MTAERRRSTLLKSSTFIRPRCTARDTGVGVINACLEHGIRDLKAFQRSARDRASKQPGPSCLLL